MDNTTTTIVNKMDIKTKKITASGLLKKYNITVEQADTLLEQIFDELEKEDDEEEEEEVEGDAKTE